MADPDALRRVRVALDVFEAVSKNPHIDQEGLLAFARVMAKDIRDAVGPAPMRTDSLRAVAESEGTSFGPEGCGL